ncbi:hypothetical protein D3C87_524260 [compost metagenome]
MKTLKFKFIAFLIVITAVGACSSDSNEQYCFRSLYTAVKTVSGPDTTTVNTAITIDVNYIPLGKCGVFKTFSETDTFPKEIKVLVDYEGCDCPLTDKVATQPYTFKAATAGEYILKFQTADPNAPVTKTITVTE